MTSWESPQSRMPAFRSTAISRCFFSRARSHFTESWWASDRHRNHCSKSEVVGTSTRTTCTFFPTRSARNGRSAFNLVHQEQHVEHAIQTLPLQFLQAGDCLHVERAP